MATFKAVADTNVFIAAEITESPTSPNLEFVARWQAAEFDLLFSDEILIEYIRKLREKNVERDRIADLVGAIIKLGVKVEILSFHFPAYPDDEDDIAFLLCSLNGRASHLVTNDRHLLVLAPMYRGQVTICKTVPFLQELRAAP
jgi:putative PIN family toxin of toxin-antitoxin system